MSVQSQDVYLTAGVPLSVIGSGGGGGSYPANPDFSTINIPGTSMGSYSGSAFYINTSGNSQMLATGNASLIGNTTQVTGNSTLLMQAASTFQLRIGVATPNPSASINMDVSTIGITSQYVGVAGTQAVAIKSGALNSPAFNAAVLLVNSSINLYANTELNISTATGVDFNNSELRNVSSINGYDAQSLPYTFSIQPTTDVNIPANISTAVSSVIVAPFPLINGSQYQLSGQLVMSSSWVDGGAWGNVTAKLRVPSNPQNTAYEWIDTGVSYNSASTLRGTAVGAGSFNFVGGFTSGAFLKSTFVTLYVPTNYGGPAYTLIASSITGKYPVFPNGWTVTDLGTIYPTPPLV